ncbi:MAG TPA: sulfatase-like hydrolase/transferase [Thermoanaerobaculia bacterium]|nr:sulfatase-like hydrolase/transferase [Thermoanaerobaculia bacterium]
MRLHAALLAAALTLSCGSPEPAAPLNPQIPVFIISIDTLRSDRLSVYGDAGAVTPSFDRFREDAILFEHAFSHTPLTLPSHASILTGLLPPGHRVRDNGGYVIEGALQTIQSTLRAFGYGTGAAVSSYVLRRATGSATAFQFFDDVLPPASHERSGDATREALTRWLHARRGRNVFGFLHLFEPHAPYEPPATVVRPRSGYDGEVTAADAVLGSFLDDLEKRGLYRDALIFVLSDHGEGLGDHDEDEHGVFLYREAIQVPLLVKLPGNRRAGETVSHTVGLVDVFPTILDVLGLPPNNGLDGRSLLASPEAPRSIYSETFFPRLHLGWSESFSIVDDSHHYIDAPRSELYRYRSDPAERENIIAEERRIAAAMRERMQDIDRSLNAPGPVTEEERRSLAALGYVGSASSTSGALPDPKDRILTLRSLKGGLIAFRSRQYTRAVQILTPLTSEAPELVDAWTLLAESQLALGQTANAIATMRQAVARFPARADIRFRLAEFLIEARDAVGAIQLLNDIEAAPPPRTFHYRKAEALLQLGRVEEGERELRREIELYPDHVEAWGALAAVLAGRGRTAESREVLRQAIQRNPTDRARGVARDTLVAAGDQEGLGLLGLR